MSKDHSGPISIILGALTATAVSSLFLQIVAAFTLGIIGALGGYIFNRYMKEHLDRFVVVVFRIKKTSVIEKIEKDEQKAE